MKCLTNYCDNDYPCNEHPDFDKRPIELRNGIKQEVTEVKITELPIKVIVIIPMPCGHSYPQPEKKIFDCICGFCDSKFHVEIKEDVVELTRM